MVKKKLHQCQDCGCPGSKIEYIYDPKYPARATTRCPYCRRSTKPVPLSEASRLAEDWNSMNRENLEGLG